MNEKQLYKDWELFRINLLKETPLEFELPEVKIKRIAKLVEPGNYEAFFKYYFPNYCYAPPASFHKKASKRLIETDNIYEVRAWSRELAKSARTMLEVMYLALTGKVKNVILISASNKSAVNLLNPYRINFEINQRIINDFGDQKGLKWEEGHFVTRCNVAFSAFGAGESPRGTRNEDIRPDVVIFDDIDTDEEVRNPARIKTKWDWIEQAVMPTVSVSKNKRIIFCGNIIGKDTCITRASVFADHYEIVNIRDKNGNSTWPEKNTENAIDHTLSKISYRSGQKEYFNNPISEGTVFKEVNWKRCEPLGKYQFLVCYTDPSFKDSKKNDFKATVLIGMYKDEFHVLKAYIDQTSTRKMVEWHYDIEAHVNGKTAVYYYMEANFIQDILLNEFDTYAVEKGKLIPIRGDERSKPDKFTRIESNLEPLMTRGKLWFDEREKDNPNMKRLEEQFLLLEPGSRAHDDGPDAVEGGVWIINNKLRRIGKIETKPHSNSSKNRF